MQLPPPIHGVSVMNKIIKESKLINDSFECDYINLATAKNINDLQKGFVYKYFLTVGIAFRAIYKMMFNRYDYVYITVFPWGFAFIKDSLIVLIARIFRLKPILHLHTHGFKRSAEKSQFRKKLYKYVFKNVEVICLSPFLIEDIELIYSGAVYILPNGIPQVNFENNYKVTQGPVKLLYLSNLIKGKGILLLINAIEKLVESGYTIKLRVVGSEGDLSYLDLEKLIKEKKLKEVIELIGPKFGEEKYAEFRNADVFILPSNYDTFGLVLLEAMQFGVPCISTNIGGIPDVLGEGRGVIMNEISSDAVYLAVKQLLDNPEKRNSMSSLGYKYYISHFTVNVFEKKLFNILDRRADQIDERLIKNGI